MGTRGDGEPFVAFQVWLIPRKTGFCKKDKLKVAQQCANVCFIKKIKYKWWPKEYTADFLQNQSIFCLSVSAYCFSMLLILAFFSFLFKLLGKQCRKSQVAFFFLNRCLPSQKWMIPILAKKQNRKDKWHSSKTCASHLFGIIYVWEKKIVQFTGLMDTITLKCFQYSVEGSAKYY